ncbi:MAG TPA: antibiotic biosynthesis monooxygenase family protein [Nitrososphaeraceae archaeon]
MHFSSLPMVKIVEMDESMTLKAQFEEDVGPVVLLNKFTVKPEDVDQFLNVFADTTAMFKQQPGFISAQLHRGIGNSTTYFNYVVWESAQHFKQAFEKPEFLSNMAGILPNVVMSPHLFKKVAVPGICVD